MKKWWQWFILSGIHVIILIIRCYERAKYINDGRAVISGYLFTAILLAVLGVTQYFCDKYGEKGKKLFNRICMVSATVLILFLIFILLKVFL